MTGQARLDTKIGRSWLLLPVLLGLYPLSIVIGAVAVVESIDPWTLCRIAALGTAISLGIYAVLCGVIADPKARLQWLTTFMLVEGTYSIVINTLRLAGATWKPEDHSVAIAYTGLAAAVATVGARPWIRKRRDLAPACFVALLLVGANSWRAFDRWWNDPPPRWIGAADALTYAPVSEQHLGSAPAQDIYYILLDELGRADVLRDIYGVDARGFISQLRSLGFYVPAEARTNYPHTVLSVSSFLNLNYLTSVADAAGPELNSRAPVEYLIRHNALMRLAENAGYHVLAIGADVSPFKRYDEANECLCEQEGLSIFEQAVVETTPLAAFPMDGLTYGAHRRKLLSALSALQSGWTSTQREFVFAHVLLPHPPFTFGANGDFRRPAWPFTFSDGDDFPGTREEYRTGYREQATFVLGRIVEIVRAILSRPGPKPVIIIHGDHGPGSQLFMNDATRTNMTERMSIFAAYYFPGGDGQFYPTMTPVNANRILSNRYLGTALPRLPDHSYFSTKIRPFDFVQVLGNASDGQAVLEPVKPGLAGGNTDSARPIR